MKKLLAIATLLAGAGSAYALDLSISASVPEAVSLTAGTAYYTTTGNIASTTDSKPVGTAVSFSGNSTITVTSSSTTAKLTFSSVNNGKLQSNYSGTVPTGWAKEVSYTLNFGDKIGNADTSALTLTSANSVNIGSVTAQNINGLSITPTGDKPLVAGTYSDTVTVTISAV